MSSPVASAPSCSLGGRGSGSKKGRSHDLGASPVKFKRSSRSKSRRSRSRLGSRVRKGKSRRQPLYCGTLEFMSACAFKRANPAIIPSGSSTHINRECQKEQLDPTSVDTLNTISDEVIAAYKVFLNTCTSGTSGSVFGSPADCDKFLFRPRCDRATDPKAALAKDVDIIKSRVKTAVRIAVVKDPVGDKKTYIPLTTDIQAASECGKEFTLEDLMPRIIVPGGPEKGYVVGSKAFRSALAKEDAKLLAALSYADRQALLSARVAGGGTADKKEVQQFMVVNSGPLAQALYAMFGLPVQHSYDCRLIKFLFADVRGTVSTGCKKLSASMDLAKVLNIAAAGTTTTPTTSLSIGHLGGRYGGHYGGHYGAEDDEYAYSAERRAMQVRMRQRVLDNLIASGASMEEIEAAQAALYRAQSE